MFVACWSRLLEAWGDLKPIWGPVTVITILSTVVVMIVTGRSTPVCNPKEQEEGQMIEFIENSLFFGAALSLIGYEIGLLLKRKFKMAFFNRF